MSESSVAETDLDFNALADAWLGSPVEQEETAAPESQPSGEGVTPESVTEGSNETPTQQVTITPEMEEEIFQRRLNAQLARAREAKADRELQTLLESGSDEEVAAFTRRQIAETQARQQREAIELQAEGRGAVSVIEQLLDDSFVNSLTREEANRLLPVEFGGEGRYSTDQEYITAIKDMRASKARTGLYTEEDVQRLVAERTKGQQNFQRGNQFSQSSPSMTPASTATEDRHAGKEGQELKDSLWSEVAEGWDRSDE